MALETFSETIGSWSITKLATYIKAIVQESLPTSLTLKNLVVTEKLNIDSLINPLNAELAYSERTSDLTLTTSYQEIMTTGEKVYDDIPILVEVFIPQVDHGGTNNLEIELFDGSTGIGILGRIASGQGNIASYSFTGKLRFVPTAGLHEYRVQAKKNDVGATAVVKAGLGGSATLIPAFIRISKDRF